MAGYRAELAGFPDGKHLIAKRIALFLLVLSVAGLAQSDDGVDDGIRERGPSDLALFSQPFCPGCEAAKQYFNENGIAFVEFDISSSPKARDVFERLGGRGTPFLVIDGKRVHGFSRQVIEQRLGKSGLLEENQ